MNSDHLPTAASHHPGAQVEQVNPNQVLPPNQAPDLLEDTALPISGLQEAFAKAHKWQQQQQELEQQSGNACKEARVKDHAAAAEPASTVHGHAAAASSQQQDTSGE